MPNLLASITSTTADSAPASWADVKDLVATVTVDSVNSIILLIAHLPIDITTGTDNQPDARFAVGGVREGPQLALGVEDAVDEGHGGMMIYALTGLSGSQTFSLQWQKLLAGSCLTDGSRPRSFQVIELLDGEADLLVNASSTSSSTAPGTYANIAGMSGVASVSSTDSVVLMLLNMVIDDRGSSNGADFQFAIDGTREGAETSPTIDDNGGKASAGAFTHALTGISGSKTFSCQWQLRHGSNADTDTDRERRFQVLELKSADLLTSVVNTTGGSAPATYADVPGFSGAVTISDTGSVVFLGANVAIESTGGDQTADGQFADGGTREGPEMTFTYVDDTGGHLVSSGMCWAKTGVSGSKTFSFQWQDRLLTPVKETGRNSTFYVIELKALTGAAQFIDPTAIGSAEAHGTPQINFGINPAAITSAEAHGTPTMLATIPVDPIASAEAFGTPVVVSLFTILADAIVSAEAFGVPLIQMFLNPDAVTSEEAVGAPILRCTIGVDSVASAEAFGELVIEMFLVPAGIASEEAFGTVTVICVIHGLPGIPSEEAFGGLKILMNISPLGLASLEAFGAPQIDFTILPDTVPSGEAFGLPVLGMTVNVDAVPSGEAFGTPTLNVVIGPLVGISSEETVNDIIAMISGRPPIQTPIRTGRPWWFDQVIGRRG